jgi:hypothetical protein
MLDLPSHWALDFQFDPVSRVDLYLAPWAYMVTYHSHKWQLSPAPEWIHIGAYSGDVPGWEVRDWLERHMVQLRRVADDQRAEGVGAAVRAELAQEVADLWNRTAPWGMAAISVNKDASE